jgi:hypothetical protein
MKNQKYVNRWIKFSLIIWIYFFSININSQGHYNGASFNPNDYFVPPSGWIFSFYYSYNQMDYYNASGNKTDLIEINKTPPFSVEIGQKVATNSIIPLIIFGGSGEVLNANWGILAIPTINNPSANVALDFYSGQDIAFSESIDLNTWGLGDLYVQPVWLTWEKNEWAATFSYGTWLPIGKYEANSSENVGLGYWSHNFRLAGRFKPAMQISLVSAFTYELNSKQKDVDFTEAPHLTIDYGASYTFLMGHEVGFFGFGTWQIGDDSGEKSVLPADQIYGIGIFGSYWFIPGKLGALSRFTTNFGTENRFGGFAFQIGLNYLLFD